MTEKDFMTKFTSEMTKLLTKAAERFKNCTFSPENAETELNDLMDILINKFDYLQNFVTYQKLQKQFETKEGGLEALEIGELVSIDYSNASSCLTIQRALNPEAKLICERYQIETSVVFGREKTSTLIITDPNGRTYEFSRCKLNPDYPYALIKKS